MALVHRVVGPERAPKHSRPGEGRAERLRERRGDLWRRPLAGVEPREHAGDAAVALDVPDRAIVTRAHVQDPAADPADVAVAAPWVVWSNRDPAGVIEERVRHHDA